MLYSSYLRIVSFLHFPPSECAQALNRFPSPLPTTKIHERLWKHANAGQQRPAPSSPRRPQFPHLVSPPYILKERAKTCYTSWRSARGSPPCQNAPVHLSIRLDGPLTALSNQLEIILELSSSLEHCASPLRAPSCAITRGAKSVIDTL